MKDKNRNRWIWIIVILLAFIGIAETIRRTLIIEDIIHGFSPPKYPGFNAGFVKHRKLTLLHMIPAVAFMIFGPYCLPRKFKCNRVYSNGLEQFFSFPPILLE